MQPTIYLASTSPRRFELLQTLNIPFATLKIDVPEFKTEQETAFEYVARLSKEKALAGLKMITENKPVIGADTIGLLDGNVLEKPKDEQDALRMLKLLSGRTHQVLTGLTVATRGGIKTEVIVVDVTFREISEIEMINYVASKEPLDKAGAYGIQGAAGSFVKEIKGNYQAIIGLPLAHLVEMLEGC